MTDEQKKTAAGERRGRIFTRREFLQFGASMAATGVAIAVPGLSGAATAREFRTIETTNGKIRGQLTHGVAEFKGIRYGASTAGANRFLPPQPVVPWVDVRDALSLGNQCPQPHLDLPAWVDGSPASEDCLSLNVFAPEEANPQSRLPVMVWLHGGAYIFGSASSPIYKCENLARSGGVVTVGINHRLNIFGYTFLGDDAGHEFATSGNAGHLDIVAALAWIKQNISQFGGDPGNVTLFGESGGGGKSSALLGMPGAKGLQFNTNRAVASVLIQMGDVAQAEAYVRRSQIAIQEARTSGHPNWRSAYAKFGQSWEGELELSRALIFEARGQFADAEAAYRQGVQLFARGDTSSALTQMRSSIAANPDYAPAWRGLKPPFFR